MKGEGEGGGSSIVEGGDVKGQGEGGVEAV